MDVPSTKLMVVGVHVEGTVFSADRTREFAAREDGGVPPDGPCRSPPLPFEPGGGAYDWADIEVRLVLGKLGGFLGCAVGALAALQTAVSRHPLKMDRRISAGASRFPCQTGRSVPRHRAGVDGQEACDVRSSGGQEACESRHTITGRSSDAPPSPTISERVAWRAAGLPLCWSRGAAWDLSYVSAGEDDEGATTAGADALDNRAVGPGPDGPISPGQGTQHSFRRGAQ